MLFNSIDYIIFFPVVAIIYFAVPAKYRRYLLLAASYYFYMSWKAEYALLIVASTLVDYYAGIAIYKASNTRNKKIYLHLSLLVNLGILFSFKYFNFFGDSLRHILQNFSLNFTPMATKFILPIGISFYTFQTMSYTLDVYRGRLKPEYNLGIFALYVSFFPQLVAGPIERAENLIPQFYTDHTFEYKRVTNGLKLMLWGFFKKIVVADRLSTIVAQVYGDYSHYNAVWLIISTFFFGFQIYCDFSGYCDIAIGSAQVMGFNLRDNFNRPYFSDSISNFWKRWHISLSSWFKDYVYIPLGGNRSGNIKTYVNLLTVFILSGLWHGASWTFILWGLYHGLLVIFEKSCSAIAKLTGIHIKMYGMKIKFVRIFVTFCAVNMGWIFFRSPTVNTAFDIYRKILHPDAIFLSMNFPFDPFEFTVSIMGICFIVIVHLMQRHYQMRQFLSTKNVYTRWVIYLILIFSILLLGPYNKEDFIYFQF